MRSRQEKDATILAHFYVDGEIQDIADFTGDSLKLARDATRVTTSTIVFAGVHFMGESAKIMNPQKRVLIPDMLAGCSLADSCPPDQLAAFQEQLRSQGRDFQTVAYINTSAAVKSLCDWIVTSGNAREIIDRVPKDKEILFVPDQHLGRYLMEITGRKMILWPGSCMVHEIFSIQDLIRSKKNNPGCIVIAHPECPQNILEITDFDRWHGKDAAVCDGIEGTDDISCCNRSSHDSSHAESSSAAYVYSGPRNHGVVRRNVCLQSLPAYGSEHAAESSRLPAGRPTGNRMEGLFSAGPRGAR
jgi:quinolinate synthetase A subunit